MMFMKPAIAGMLALGLTMGGCATTGTTTSTTTPSTNFSTLVQNAAILACGFEPALASIASIWIAEGSPDQTLKDNADLTAQKLCQAYAALTVKSAPRKIVRTASGAFDFGPYTVNGKKVEIIGTLK